MIDDCSVEMPTDPGALAEEIAHAALFLARRFAAGATLWCVAPQWPSHGRHVAVEFVHPVIVGKRALPAVFLDGGELARALRLLARPGDVLLALGVAGDERTDELLRRGEAWGLGRISMGAGPRRPAPRAEHVIWWDSPDPALAARSGDVVLCYHLLWELTHVVFEHPGLLVDDPPCTGEVCITCADEGPRSAEVRAVSDTGVAEVVCDGRLEQVDVSLVERVRPDDLVLVHAGVVLTTLCGGSSEAVVESRP